MCTLSDTTSLCKKKCSINNLILFSWNTRPLFSSFRVETTAEMNQTHKVLHHDTLRMFPQQGTSFPRHLMIAFRTLAGPTSQILQLASLTRCHPQVGQGILQSPVNLWLCLHNREIWHCSAVPKSSIAVSCQILFSCPIQQFTVPSSVKSDSQVTRV